MNLPGFTAEASLGKTPLQYRPRLSRNALNGMKIVAQMSAGGLGDTGGPFSGSCGCWPGVCCCILCYFNVCTLWCWSTVESAA